MSVRLKLALSYAGFLVAAGVALSVVLLIVLRYIPDENIVQLSNGQWVPNRGDLLQVFWRWIGVALLGLAVVGVAGGWLLAGRMLAPLARVHAAAIAVEAGSLDHRIRLGGPRDEMRELADAFDAMVARLERTFDEQQRFAANASHELRTPHAVIRTMLEVAQADPDGTDTAELLRRLTATNERAIASTEALLSLARVEREPLQRSAVDLAAIAAGSGLGLAIVASIVRVHDGELALTRQIEGGLRVSVTLPRG